MYTFLDLCIHIKCLFPGDILGVKVGKIVPQSVFLAFLGPKVPQCCPILGKFGQKIAKHCGTWLNTVVLISEKSTFHPNCGTKLWY